jgi:hypothetical protein
VNYSFIAFLIASLASLLYLKRIGITHLLLLIVFTVMSFMALRYVIFYMLVAAPILARIINNVMDERIVQKIIKTMRLREGFLSAISCIVGIFLVFKVIPAFALYNYGANTTYHVPKGAADFISSIEIKDNIFNEYGFGGYLIWRLHPGKNIFIDGRALDPDVFKEYQIVASALENPDHDWKDIIKKYDISCIVMPPLLNHGAIFPLVERLFDSEEWVLIYIDHLSLVFLHDTPENSSLIKQYAINKYNGLQTIVVQASAKALKNRVNPHTLISAGKAFFKMGKFDEAEKAFFMADKRDPGNQDAMFWLQKLSEYRKTIDNATGDKPQE